MSLEITDEQVVQHLKQKESNLLMQLEKVRAALFVYDIVGADTSEPSQYLQGSGVQLEFDPFMSYDQKVIFSLRGIEGGYINHMVDYLLKAGDDTDQKKLYNGLTGAASRLYRAGILKADTRGKKYKYYLNPDTEKERAEILPL
ncbi:hypothetical protein EWM62_13745 [Mucilaginibacter terrigena]|uniref:Uncharacterized protein n=1 Tax=Mucilaginibacter terrigena TaxID=2492395 RepID=A0A4V1ZBL9_9SPHI|nr:hypothetical protein [Mucilaginibacter terrigena]RYU89387.1 hypothetical protein EWM62_13745 [Mucilaginibacter terrigena]